MQVALNMPEAAFEPSGPNPSKKFFRKQVEFGSYGSPWF